MEDGHAFDLQTDASGRQGSSGFYHSCFRTFIVLSRSILYAFIIFMPNPDKYVIHHFSTILRDWQGFIQQPGFSRRISSPSGKGFHQLFQFFPQISQLFGLERVLGLLQNLDGIFQSLLQEGQPGAGPHAADILIVPAERKGLGQVLQIPQRIDQVLKRDRQETIHRCRRPRQTQFRRGRLDLP